MKKKVVRNSLFIASSLAVLLVSTSAVIVKNINASNQSSEKIKEASKVLLTFDPNGGTLTGDKVFEITSNTKFKDIANKPSASKSGVSSTVGWYYLDGSNKVVVNDDTTFSSDTTLYADWKLYKVTFDAGEGSFTNGDKTKVFNDVTIIHSDELVAPTLKDHTFAGWKINGTGDYITFPYSPKEEGLEITLKADYTHKETVTLAFSANGGKFSNNKIINYVDVAFGTTWNDIVTKDLLPIEEPTIDADYLFSKWNINNAEIPGDTKFTSTTFIKAKYENAISVTFNVNANGGTWSDGSTTTSIVSPKIKLANKPSLKSFKDAISYTVPKKGDITLLGWFDNKDANGEALNLDSTEEISNTSSFEIYAYYYDSYDVTYHLTGATKLTGVDTYNRKDNLTWTFKGSEGYTLKENNITCEWGNSTKARGTDYTFTVDENNVGTLTIKDAPKDGIVISISSDINNYGISKELPDKGVNSLTVDSAADYGATVNVSTDIHEGYSLVNIEIYKDGETTAYQTITSTSGSFTMPASNVKVKVNVKVNNYTITKNALPTGVASLTVAENADYDSTVTVSATNSEGYTLGNITIYNATTSAIYKVITSGQSFTMPAYNVKVGITATINSYKLSFDGNGGTVSTNSIDVNYNTKLTDAITGASIADPSNEEAAFKGWGVDTSTLLTNETMPASNKTVYAIYYKYNFLFIDGDHGQISGTTSYNNKYTLSKEDFSSSTSVTTDEGYTFTGNYEIYVGDSTSKILTTDFDAVLKPGKLTSPVKEDATIKIKPVFVINTHKATFNFNGGTIKKDGATINSLDIDYGEKILDELADVTATSDNSVFLSWEMTKQDGSVVSVSEDTTMPDGYVTLKPLWKTCNVTLSGENCTLSTTSLTNKTVIYDREGFSITPTGNYVFDHYEYSFDNVTFTSLSSMPFKPFVIKSDLEHNATVYLKAVCVTKIDLFLFADGGLFKDGNNYKIESVIKGKKWSEIKDSLEKPTKESATFLKWVDYDTGSDISDDTVIESSMILKAVYQ